MAHSASTARRSDHQASSDVGRTPALKRLLVATDFSLHAEYALGRAARLPLARGAHIQLVHVTSEGVHHPDRVPNVQSTLEIEREELAAHFDASTGVRIDTNIVAGIPWMEIVRAARTHRAELVIIGAHAKREGLLALGSTAREVVRRGSSAVLVTRGPANEPYRRPLVAVDLADVSRALIDAALLVVEGEVPLRLVHAFHVPFEGFVATSSSRADLAAFRRHYREEAQQRLSALVAAIGPGARCSGIVRNGEPCGVIAHEIAKRGTDLLVAGTHGRTGLSHLVLGSVAQWLLDNTPCDVLVGRPERFPIAGP